MSDFKHGITITVERDSPGGHDENGDPIPSTTSTHTIENCAVAPRMSDELDAHGRAGVIVGLTLLASYDADIRRTDRVVVEGDRYTVEGVPGRWQSPFTGRKHGIQVALRHAEG